MPKPKGSGMGGYKEFSDVPKDSREYEGDGHEQVEFFRNYSNAEEIINGMDEDSRDAVMLWGEGHMMWGQQYRNGWDGMNNFDKKLTELYDSVLDKSEIKHGVVVTRLADAQLLLGNGNKTATMEDLKKMQGKTVISTGNMSASASSQGLNVTEGRIFDRLDKTVEYRIHIPSGSKGAGMWIGDSRINNWGVKQREVMMNRDIALKVGTTTYDSDRKISVVNLHYVGRMKHDYGTSGRLAPNSLEYYNRM